MQYFVFAGDPDGHASLEAHGGEVDDVVLLGHPPASMHAFHYSDVIVMQQINLTHGCMHARRDRSRRLPHDAHLGASQLFLLQ